MVDLAKGEKHKLLIGLTNLAADLPKMQQFSGHYVFLNDESVPEVQGFEITKIQLYRGVVAHVMYIEFEDVFFRQNCSHSILKDRKVELADSKKVPQFPSHHCNFNQDLCTLFTNRLIYPGALEVPAQHRSVLIENTSQSDDLIAIMVVTGNSLSPRC